MRVRELEYTAYSKLNDMVEQLTGSKELAQAWWLSPNAAFDMKYPYACQEEIVSDYLLMHLLRE